MSKTRRSPIRIRNLISNICFDKIVIVATHVVSDIESIADEIIMLKKGDVICQKTPQQLMDEIEGNVVEVVMPKEDYMTIMDKFVVSVVHREKDKIKMRVVISDKVGTSEEFKERYKENIKEEYMCQLVSPTLDDYYLYVFEA